MAVKRVRMVTYLEGLLSVKSDDLLITWPCKITMKLGKMVTYLERLLLIKSHDPLITWYYEVK